MQWIRSEGGGESPERLVQSAAREWKPPESQDPETREEQWVTTHSHWVRTLIHTLAFLTSSLNILTEFDVGASPICKDPLGWMFSRLDTNFDLQLDQSEIKSLYLDRNEPCSDAFFQSCDTHPDKVITSSEWCTGFQRYTGLSHLWFLYDEFYLGQWIFWKMIHTHIGYDQVNIFLTSIFLETCF